MRIVFFGTGDFSATILSGLIDNGYEVVAVVSQPDKVNGRNNKIKFSSVKQLCIDKDIPIYQFDNLNLEGEEILKSLNPDIFITASFGQIIKQNILDIPPFGIYNVHGSLLPKYRGPAPIQWAIINGEKTSGVTIMRTELGIDSGEMYLKREMPIFDTDTASSVFTKMSVLGVECLCEFLSKFEYYVANGESQDEDEATYFPMLKKEDSIIDFNLDAVALSNLIRGREMNATCYFIYKGARYKIYFAKTRTENGRAGEIIYADSKNGLVVATLNGAIEIVEFQPEGKARMQAKAYMNSNKFIKGDIIENS